MKVMRPKMETLMKTARIATLALSLVLAQGLAQAPQAFASCGKACGGGGLTITVNGRVISVDRYLAERKIEKQELVRKVDKRLARLKAVDPELALSIKRDIEELDWYFVDQPLTELPFTRTKIPFKATQTMLQIDDNVFVERASYNSMESDDAQADLLIHEVFMRRFLKLEGVSNKITKGSIFKAVDLITKEKLGTKKELDAAFERLGFSPGLSREHVSERLRGIVRGDEGRLIPVDGAGLITLKQVQEIKAGCFVMNEDSLMTQFIRKAYPENPIYANFTHADLCGKTYETGQERHDPISITYELDSLPLQILSLKYSLTWINMDRNSPTKSRCNAKRIETTMLMPENLVPKALQREGVYAFGDWHRDPLSADKTEIRKFANLINNIRMPEIRYEFEPTDRVYDDWGKLNPNLRLKNFAIDVPVQLLENGYKIRLVNPKNGVVTPVELEVKTYVDCLVNSLRNASRKAGAPSKGPKKGKTGE